MQEDTDGVVPSTNEEKLAKVISYLFHPLLMPTYGFAFIFFTKNYISTFTAPNLKWIILGVTFVFTFFLPSINAIILLKMGRIKSLEMESSTERSVPYISTSFYYLALFYLFYNAQFPSVFKILILGAAISVLLSFIINFWWKISAHTIGIGGLSGAALGIIYRLQIDMQFMLMILLLISGIVAYARLRLKTHTPSQVYSGFALGFFVELLLMIFY
ncbi:MAG: hypothetical protein A3F72_11315 [Bacteroidetes bacterium RIFCSPLOWO2_12_FULL_35_15]|nr:MAG: hypothetical protein A3F72_11315 [Bacteroidetes bacterium RIFCSPLOWO2_12_FULL_35_15]